MKGLGGRIDALFHAPVPAARLGAFRALVCAVALYDVLLYSGLVLGDAAAVSAGGPTRPWNPLLFCQVLHIEPVGIGTARTLYAVAVVSLVCGTVGLCSRLACAVGAVAFYWWTGLAYSFGKPHHDKVALAFAIAALPFARVGAAVSIDAVLGAVRRAWRGLAPREPAAVSGMPIRLTQVTLAIGYCGAGTAKLLLGGVEWFNGYTLQGIMLGHDGEWSRFFAANVTLAQVQSVGVVLVQAAFPLVFVWPRSRWFFLPAAASFHLMTWKTMDTGPYMRVWLLLFAFVPMEAMPAALRGWLHAGGLRAAATGLAVVLVPLLVGSILADVVAVPLLLALAAPFAAALALSLWPCRRVELHVDPARRSHRVLHALVAAFDWADCVARTVWRPGGVAIVAAAAGTHLECAPERGYDCRPR